MESSEDVNIWEEPEEDNIIWYIPPKETKQQIRAATLNKLLVHLTLEKDHGNFFLAGNIFLTEIYFYLFLFLFILFIFIFLFSIYFIYLFYLILFIFGGRIIFGGNFFLITSDHQKIMFPIVTADNHFTIK